MPTITDVYATVKNPLEQQNAWREVIGCLKGTWNVGEWKTSFPDSDGWYRKYSQFWEAKLVATIEGTVTLRLPFKAKECTIRVVDTASLTQSLYYIQIGQEVEIAGSGHTIIYVDPVRTVR
ncbi:MAG: hypothetical protein D4S01_03845 [Dehalococcoidia bacterium]|nr:MAG: hypothetical protein D4S01_03845 [Dehalococcoidia bacterium]